jgi:hypothetical protein
MPVFEKYFFMANLKTILPCGHPSKGGELRSKKSAVLIADYTRFNRREF